MATYKDKNDRNFRIISNKNDSSMNFNKIAVGKETLKDDVTADINFFKKSVNNSISKEKVLTAIERKNIQDMRTISNLFYLKSGIYMRLCKYMAHLYRYDWFITPIIMDMKVKEDKVIEDWYKCANLLENSNLKRTFGDIALKVITNGCYYGYKIDQKTASYLQELPIDYCRSRYQLNGKPAVEFNIKFFNDAFSDGNYRLKVLKMFPKEFQKAYMAYQNGTLPVDFQGDEKGWFLLDPNKAVKFNLDNSDAPLFMAVIPKLMDLEEAQELDKKKMLQQILRIIIQKMPIDKNGDLIFDVEEAQALHSNAVAMLGKAIGVNVLTTFADVDVADMSDKSNVSSVDQLEKMERSAFNESGIHQGQFNSNGNLALDKSTANDEATMSDLVLQFEDYAESLLEQYNRNSRRLVYKVQILPTTVYNYKDLAKLYKEQTMIGFSKLLPQVALGQSQMVVMSTAYFENKLLKLDNLFVPPQMSSTMSGKVSSNEEAGRPELPDDQKSEKTIQNIEAGG